MKILRDYQKKAVNECWKELISSNEPVLLVASVGSGKSLMISSILETIQKAGKKALCLVNNAELVRNNCQTFIDQGGKASIYCAALNSKDISESVIFGTPQTILNAIKKNEKIADIRFNIIVVDEAHMINYQNHKSTFMRILRHYKQEYHEMRLLGATGTDYRFKGHDIVGKKCLFKKRVGNITTDWLIKNGYLVKPVFKVDPELTIDFSKVKIKSNGKFDEKELAQTVDKNTRLTALIMHQLMHIMESQNRHGCVIFATTKKHAHECASHLPPHQTAVVLGEMPNEDRTEIFNKARTGEIKYLINISIVSVGVDLPPYDTLAYLRPTESLVLVVQTMGRVLRLSPNKTDALIIDCAGNIDRHSDWDNPVLLDALQQTRDKDAEPIFKCYKCETMNTEHARRCVGIVDNKRCDFYFEFKDCGKCETQNDITARYCRQCDHELIDPNAKLSISPFSVKNPVMEVLKAKYWLQDRDNGFIFNAAYQCENGAWYSERFSPCASEKAKYFFYGQFVKKHVKRSSIFFPYLTDPIWIRAMLNEMDTPSHLHIVDKKIKKKIFSQDMPE